MGSNFAPGMCSFCTCFVRFLHLFCSIFAPVSFDFCTCFVPFLHSSGAKTGAKTVKFSLFLHLPWSSKSPEGANDWGVKGRTFGGSKGERLGVQRANDWGLKKESKIKLRIVPSLN